MVVPPSMQELKLSLINSVDTPALVVNTFTGSWDLDLHTEILSCDAMAAGLLGLGATAFHGPVALASAQVDPEDNQRIRAARDRAFETNTPFFCEYRVLTPEGRQRWVLSSARPVFDELGRPWRMIGAVRDISERKQAEQVLFESERKFRTLAECLPHIFWITNSDGSIGFVNQHWYEYTGQSTQTPPTNKAWIGLIHSGDLTEAFRLKEADSTREKTVEVKLRIRSRSGEFRWHVVRSVFLEECEGVCRRFGTATDIHEQVIALEREYGARFHAEQSESRLKLLARAGAALGRSLEFEETLKAFVDVIVPGFCDGAVIDLFEEGGPKRVAAKHIDSFRCDLMYELHERFQGRNSIPAIMARLEETNSPFAVYKSAEEINSGLTGRCQREFFDLFQKLKANSAITVLLRGKDRNLGVAIFVSSASSGRTLSEEDAALALQLADRAATSIEKAKLYYKAQEAIAARDIFLSVASHELKTPLTILKLQAGLMQQRIRQLNADQTKLMALGRMVDQCDRAVDRLTRLIDEMLDVSRIQTGRLHVHREKVSLKSIVDEVLDRFALPLEKAEILLEYSAESAVLGCWDASRIDQVVTNLVTNAIRYAPGKKLQVRVYGKGGKAVLEVADGGRGIPKELKERVFERFERVAPDHKTGGLGLGLFITREIVQAHGGTISVDSDLGQGARFIVELPREE